MFPGLDLYRTDRFAQHLIAAGYDLDDPPVDDVSVHDLFICPSYDRFRLSIYEIPNGAIDVPISCLIWAGVWRPSMAREKLFRSQVAKTPLVLIKRRRARHGSRSHT